MIYGSDHWFITPSAWSAVPPNRRRKIRDHIFKPWSLVDKAPFSALNRKVDGGLELPLKLVQQRLGYATITLTADRYGHLFPSTDDGSEMADAQRALLAKH